MLVTLLRLITYHGDSQCTGGDTVDHLVDLIGVNA
jgi:hypothetical protein